MKASFARGALRSRAPLACAAAALAFGAGLLGAPRAASAETVAIVGGTVYPVSGPKIAGGTVLLRDGRIAAVGANVPVPAGARRIDARGKIVTPGLIDAYTQMGLVEVEAERSTRNDRADDLVAADFRAWEGVFSGSAYIAATREDGITSVGVMPNGPFVAGQAAVLDLSDGTAAEMLRRGPVAMVASVEGGNVFGSDADENTGGGTETAGPGGTATAPRSRAEAFALLRQVLEDARWYGAHRARYDAGANRALAASRAALEALQPVVAGREPLLLQADRVDDVEAALRLAREARVRLAIVGGTEAWRIAPRLAAARVPVLAGAMNNIPSSFDTLGARQDNLSILRRAGVEVAIVGNGGGDEAAFNARNVRYEAGNAVAYGLSHDEALRALTLGPAAILGVADRIGSLAPGKDANLVVWSGDPFEFASAPEHVFVRGREYRDRSRQDQLIERYRRLPRTTHG